MRLLIASVFSFFCAVMLCGCSPKAPAAPKIAPDASVVPQTVTPPPPPGSPKKAE